MMVFIFHMCDVMVWDEKGRNVDADVLNVCVWYRESEERVSYVRLSRVCCMYVCEYIYMYICMYIYIYKDCMCIHTHDS